MDLRHAIITILTIITNRPQKRGYLRQKLVAEHRKRRHPGAVVRDVGPLDEAAASELVKVLAGVDGLVQVLQDECGRVDAAGRHAEVVDWDGRIFCRGTRTLVDDVGVGKRRLLRDERRRRLVALDGVDALLVAVESTQTLVVDTVCQKVRLTLKQVGLAEVEDARQGHGEADGHDEEGHRKQKESAFHPEG